MRKLELSKGVKDYWCYAQLSNIYDITLKEENCKTWYLNIKGNCYNETFKIVKFEDIYMVAINGMNITEEMDFTETLDECIKGAIYYFSTRY